MRKFANQQLQKRYQTDKAFKQKVEHREKEYALILKNSEKKTEIVIEESLLEKFVTQDNRNVYFMYGHLQPPPTQHRGDLTLYFLKNFQPQYGEKYSFVYFNNHTPSADYYFEFKYLLGLLPLKLVEGLREFILVKPTFYIKACDSIGLGSNNKMFDSKYVTLETTKELLVRLKIPPKDFVSFVPEQISDEFPKQLKRRRSLASYRVNYYGQNLTQSQSRQKNEFECMIKALFTKEVYKLQNYQLGDLGIPIILQLLVYYFKTKPQGLKQEGIFRKSVSIDEENQTLEQLSRRNYQYLQQIKNPHLIASLIKKFFSNLKIPIVPFKTYEQLLNDKNAKDKTDHVKKNIKTLPELNFMTLAFVIDFLRKDVIPNQNYNKMSAHNIAICFSPSFMRSETTSMLDIAFAGKAVNISETMIVHFEQIFGSDAERQALTKKYMKDKTKDFKKQVKVDLEIHHEERSQYQSYSNQYDSIKFNNGSSQQINVKSDILQDNTTQVPASYKSVKSCNNFTKQKQQKAQKLNIQFEQHEQVPNLDFNINIPSPKNKDKPNNTTNTNNFFENQLPSTNSSQQPANNSYFNSLNTHHEMYAQQPQGIPVTGSNMSVNLAHNGNNPISPRGPSINFSFNPYPKQN